MPATSSAPGSQPESVARRNARRATRSAVKSVARSTGQAVTGGAGLAAATPVIARSTATGIAQPQAPSLRRARRAQRQARETKQRVRQIERAIQDPAKASRQLTAKTAKLAKRVERKTEVKLPTPKVELGKAEAPKLGVSKKLAKGILQEKPKAEEKLAKRLLTLPAPPKAPPVQKVRRAYVRGRKTLPGLDTEQTKVAAKVLKTGLKAGATKKELLAAAETGIVESGFRNLDYGDADSEGWRQERTSQYGPTAPTNVKGAAKRFFEESISDTGGSRGKGQTAGELAQTIQGSAFPERYDQVRSEAKPIVKAFLSGKNPKSSIKKLPGSYEGSQKAVLSLLPKGIRVEGRGDKRTPAENAAVGGAADSDHLTTNTSSYAADVPPDPKVYAGLRKKLGLPPASTGSDTVTKDGYRYQLIFGAEYDHGDHIHLGAVWTGAATTTPVSGGGGYVGASSPASAPTAATSPAPAPREKLKRGKARKRHARKVEGRQRSRFIRSLISNPPSQTEAPIAVPESSYDDFLDRKVTISS